MMLGLATAAKLNPNAEMGHRLDQIEGVDAPIIRFGIGWPGPGVAYDWKRTDTLLSAIHGRGLRVCMMLGGCGDRHALDDDHVQGYAQWVDAFTARYHDPSLFVGWECQNEVMLGTKYDTNPTPARVVALQRAFYTACKTNSDLPVGTPARIGNSGWMAACYEAGIKGSFDFCTEHPYTHTPGIGSPSASMRLRKGGWYAMHLDRVAMVANGDRDKPIWATEYGSPSGGRASDARTEAQQASDIADAAHRFATQSFLEHLFIFDGWDVAPQTNDPGDWMGLYRADGTEKPAASTFRSMVKVVP